MEKPGLLQLADAANAGDVVPLIGVDTKHLHGGVLLLEIAAGTRDGAAGAETRDQMGHGARGLTPDLGSGGLVVGFGIRRILVLIQHMEPGLLGDVVRSGNGALRRPRRRTQVVLEFDNVGPEQTQDGPFLKGNLVRHGRRQ